jgi:hypothetical protein
MDTTQEQENAHTDADVENFNFSLPTSCENVMQAEESAEQQTVPPIEIPNAALEQFSMQNAHVNSLGQTQPMPLELSRWMYLYQANAKMNQTRKSINREMKSLDANVKQYLTGRSGNQIFFPNMSTHESSMFGPPGKLKLVERTRPSGSCTQAVLFQRLAEFTLANMPGATAEHVSKFATGAVAYVFAGVPRKTSYVLERTVPKNGRRRNAPAQITAENLLMSETRMAAEAPAQHLGGGE